VRTNVCFSPIEVNVETSGFTEMLNPLGTDTIYENAGNPTFVTVPLKLPHT
jgi:hypothetical protein